MHFVGAGNLPGSCQSYGMIIFRSTFGCYQIIPTVAFEEYGTFRNSQSSAGEDVINLSDKPALPVRIFLQDNSTEEFSFPVIYKQIGNPGASVLVMEQRRIKPATVQIDGIRPFTVYLGCRHKIVVCIFPSAVEALDICVDQIKHSVLVGQIGCPDSAGVGISFHIELRHAGEWPG